MNEKNETERLEAQLRSWKPRVASATLERRLFQPVRRSPGTAWRAGWLAPAAACLMLAISLLNPQNTADMSHRARSAGLVAMISSNQSYAAYLPGSFSRTHNQLESFAARGGFLSPTNLMQ